MEDQSKQTNTTGNSKGNKVEKKPTQTSVSKIKESKNYSVDLSDYLDDVDVTWFTRFLWWCCGGDKRILLKATHYDRVKYAGIGAIILVTGILASFSGGFAFHTIFGPKDFGQSEIENIENVTDTSSSIISDYIPYVSDLFNSSTITVFFAIFWGLMIFNLDRFIISSTGKGDGKSSISLKEFGNAIPRILMALILGIVISKPLELKILQPEIDAELELVQNSHRDSLNSKTEVKFQQELKRLEELRKPLSDRKVEISKQLEERRLEIVNLRDELQKEIQGRVGSGRSGYGPAARRIEDNISRAENEYNTLKIDLDNESESINQELNDVKNQIANLDKNRTTERLKNIQNARQLDGLLARLEIADRIGGLVPLFLTLLFLFIETAPIFFKLMMEKGPYDYLEQNLKHKVMAYNGVVYEGEFYANDKEGKYLEKLRLMEVESESRLAKTRIDGQEKVNSQIVDLNVKNEEANIKKNPDNYVS